MSRIVIINGNGMKDVFARINEEHRGILATLGQLSNRFDIKVFDNFQASLAIHMRAEEDTLYAAIVDKEKEMIAGATEAHNEVLRIMDGMKRGDRFDFEDKVTDILGKLNNHIEDEEANIFPAARRMLGDEEIVRLSNRLFEIERKERSKLAQID